MNRNINTQVSGTFTEAAPVNHGTPAQQCSPEERITASGTDAAPATGTPGICTKAAAAKIQRVDSVIVRSNEDGR